MKKELFIESIKAIEQQIKLDIEISKHLSRAFPNAFSANLLPKNDLIQSALINVLKSEMNDIEKDRFGHSWIDYFLWELNFGEENFRLKAYQDTGEEIKLSNAGELYEFLVMRKSNKP